MTGARVLAAEVVREVLAGHSLTPVLDECLKRNTTLTPSERGALWDYSHGTLRHLGLLQAVAAQMVRKPLTHPFLEALLYVALYQMQFTRAPAYAIVSEAVEACSRVGFPWAKSLMNALLRRFQRERAALVEQARQTPRGRFSYPEWWITRIQATYPGQWTEILESGNRKPAMVLRVNRRRVAVSQYLELLDQAGIGAHALDEPAVVLDRIVPVHDLPGFADGMVSVQDAGAQLVPGFLGMTTGERVLDACAAPGGKTAHILEQADVEVSALDNVPERVVRLRQNLDRLGLNADVRCADASRVDEWWDGRPFDRVLADIPCTASGVVRRHPDIKWLRRDADVARLAAQAANLLDALWRVVAPGGKLLMVTCSVFQEENRTQIDDFVGRHTDARIEPLPGKVGSDLQLLPDESHDGFYYALLQRSSLKQPGG